MNLFEEGDTAIMLSSHPGLFMNEHVVVSAVAPCGCHYLVYSTDCNDGYEWEVHEDMIGHYGNSRDN